MTFNVGFWCGMSAVWFPVSIAMLFGSDTKEQKHTAVFAVSMSTTMLALSILMFICDHLT